MKKHKNPTGPQPFGTSLKKSIFDQISSCSPGPSYPNQDNPHIQRSGWSIGKDQGRNSYIEPHHSEMPSPQHYNIKHNTVDKQSHKYTFPLQKQRKKSDIITQLYCPNFKANKTQYPKFSFSSRIDSIVSEDFPGPANYHIVNNRGQTYKTMNGFGFSSRPPPYPLDLARNPGPNAYQTVNPEKDSEKYSFGSSPRTLKLKNKDPPGTYYNISTYGKKTKSSSGIVNFNNATRKTAIQVPSDTPAPNQYDISLPLKIKHGVIPHAKKQEKQYMFYNGPTFYSGHQQWVKKKQENTDQDQQLSEKGKKTSKIAKKTVEVMPGPGTYEFIEKPNKVGGVIGTYLKQIEQKQPPKYPTPSTYKPKDQITRPKAHSTIVLKSQRTDFSKTTTCQIGPQTYSPTKDTHPELGFFGLEERKDLSPKSFIPGVGEYKLPSFIGVLPKFYKNKKITEDGYSSFHERIRHKLSQQKYKKQLQKVQSSLEKQQPVEA